jgi:hypothetical protein
MKKHNLAITIASLAVSVAVLSPKSASAVTITVDFTADPTTGSLAGDVFTGSFSYDNSTVAPTGSSTATATAFTFDFPSTSSPYTSPDTLSSGLVDAATLDFTNGVLTSFEFADAAGTNPVGTSDPSFVVSEGEGIPTFLYGYDPVSGENYSDPATGSCPDALGACNDAQGSGTTSLVPEPENLAGVLTAIALGFVIKRKLSKKVEA